MRINTHKTKVIIFNKCGHFIKEDFKIGGDNIECVNKCKYLGIIMSSGGSFKETKNMLYNKALKASFKLYKDVKSLDPPVNTLLHMFDHMVKPIALYCCEIWGTLTVGKQGKNKDFEAENLNIKFCKFLLGLNKK